jgi:ATP-binding cassette subfamily F protein uup
MALIQLRDVTLGYGGPPLLEGVELAIDPGERVCLVGRNGSGKTTLLRVLAGELEPDAGEMVRRQGLRVARLGQDVPEAVEGTVFDVVAAGLGGLGELVQRYHRLSHRLAEEGGEALLETLARVQHDLEAAGGWTLTQRVETVLSRLALDAEADFPGLSGGLKRRVMLARALVSEPDLLLLDEPTNHLDIDAIAWLEEFLLGFSGTLLFITHDRAFLGRLATRIVELDRGRITSWPGSFDVYQRGKQAALDAEAQEQARFDKRLAQEEAWIRQGIKARRTRNEGRVRALEQMRRERLARREQQGRVRLQVQDGERSGRLVVEAEAVEFGYGERPIIRGLTTTILRGDKVGIIGPNGAGKTTLLRLLLGDLAPRGGRIRHGTKLEVAYFDQLRARLDGERTVMDNLEHGSDQVTVNSQARHVLSYLQEFLFTPDRARTPVKALSGGERSRLLLARLFLRPANLLVLDEPTNDLDMETLELLESRLVEYPGTVLLVSHDRAFLDHVVTSTLVLEGQGRVGEYVGGYSDWLRQRPAPAAAAPVPAPAPAPAREKPRGRPAKLSYRDKRELEALPGHIEALEREQAELLERLSDPGFYQGPAEDIAAATTRLEILEAELTDAYGRWEALEAATGAG